MLKQARIDLELTGLGQYCVSESVPNTSSISVKEPVPVKEKFDSHPSDIDQQLVKLTKDNAQLVRKVSHKSFCVSVNFMALLLCIFFVVYCLDRLVDIQFDVNPLSRIFNFTFVTAA